MIVADDSDLPSQQAANLACLVKLSRSHPEFEFKFAGLPEKHCYSKLLAQHSGIQSDIVNFALFHQEGGAKRACGPNRNALFFETVGECFLSADDDVVCRPSATGDIRQTVEVTSVEDPTRVTLFQDRRALLRQHPDSDVDIIALNESVLGTSLGALFRGRPEIPATFRRLNADSKCRLERGAAKIRVSWNGIYGDSGAKYPAYYLWKDKYTYDQLTISEKLYRKLSLTRQIFRSPTCLTVGTGAYCQSTALAYDHRTILPPFMPLRGLDVVFGKILVSCFSDSLIAYLPWALLHSPLERRGNSAKDLTRSGYAVPYYAVLKALIGMWTSAGFDGDATKALLALGGHLSSIGMFTARDFEEVLQTCLWMSVGRRIERLDRQLRFPEAPHYWSSDIRAHIDVLTERLTPAGLRKSILAEESDLAAGERLALAQRLTLRFGQLLQAWPSLIEAAIYLKSKGIRIARPVFA